MKKYAIFLLALILTGCGSSQPVNLLKKTQPILNIDSALAPRIEASLSESSARIKNISTQPMQLYYHIFWYNKNGLSQPTLTKQTTLSLAPNEAQAIELTKPTAESFNYRLYIH